MAGEYMRGVKLEDDRIEPIARCSPEERKRWQWGDEQLRARHPQKEEKTLSAAERQLAAEIVAAALHKDRKI